MFDPYLVPAVVVPGVEQAHMHAAGGLELHGLAPELGLDARLLPEAPAGRLRVARRDRRVVRHLRDDMIVLRICSFTDT